MSVYAFTKKCGQSAFFFPDWNQLYEKYVGFCKIHNIPIVDSEKLCEIVEHYYYYKLQYSNEIHYYIIKTRSYIT